jgi:hypothetical protein
MEIATDFEPDTGYRFPTLYPWSIWTDGKIRIAVRGVDYTCLDESFRGILHNRAKHLGIDVRTQRTDKGTIFQFKPLPEQAK